MTTRPVRIIVPFCAALAISWTAIVRANDTPLPIADAHVHYSHDSVEYTPPERVIELMRNAGLKFALVSSSDDNGTQLLSALAPDIIVPGLRPYRRRGELGTWFTDDGALAYVEKLLATIRYATIGEFHLFGADVDLPIPRRIVELAAEHNLILHAHSDAEAVERLLAQDPTVKVIWAHSGFESPEEIAEMLGKHDRLWADLAFRGEVGSGGQLSEDWIALFTEYPDRMMLGTDTYTPERMYFLPEHAANAREWLTSLPSELAERVAWRNAFDLIMPHWNANRPTTASLSVCTDVESPGVKIEPQSPIAVSQPFTALVTACGDNMADATLKLDARMPAHGHGMNYAPEHTVLAQTETGLTVQVDGLVLHMPGQWQWTLELRAADQKDVITRDFTVQ